MLRSDVNALNELLSPESFSTNHRSQIMTKKDDLFAHISGILNLAEILTSDERIPRIQLFSETISQ